MQVHKLNYRPIQQGLKATDRTAFQHFIGQFLQKIIHAARPRQGKALLSIFGLSRQEGCLCMNLNDGNIVDPQLVEHYRARLPRYRALYASLRDSFQET